MSILTRIAKQLLILDDRLHCAIANRHVKKAESARAEATHQHVMQCKHARDGIKQAQAEGAALIAMHEHALRNAKAEQIQMVIAAEARLNMADVEFAQAKDKASQKDSAAVQHVCTSQKAREAVKAL